MTSSTETILSQSGNTCEFTPHGQPATDKLKVAERLVAIGLTVAAVFLHGINFAKAGGFWRDEANSITLSTLPNLEKLWSALQHDSFPILHYLAIRGWALLFGSEDTSLRLMGLVVGLLFLASLWLKSACLERNVPIISLLLIGLNPVMIRYLDALRPNGLASLAVVLAFTTSWQAIRKTDTTRLALVTVTLILCAQLLFQGAIFILAIGIASIATGFIRGGIQRAALLAIPSVVAALTLLPYIGHLQQAANWAPLAMSMPDTLALTPGLMAVVKSPLTWMIWLWLLVAGGAVAGMTWRLRRLALPVADTEEHISLLLYSGLTMIIATALFALFLAKGVGISPQPWHYAPFLVLFIVTAEPLINEFLRTLRWRIMLIIVVCICGTTIISPSAQQLQTRVSSMDLVGTAITREAAPNDLVVLIPWYLGVSFSRYYHGLAPWMTFPVLRENSLHRYDLLKERMAQAETISNDLALVMTTLRQGGKVWVIGSAFAMEPGTMIVPLPSAPLPESGWRSLPYLSNWNKLLLAELTTHSSADEQLSLNTPWKFSQEFPLIRVYSGYKK